MDELLVKNKKTRMSIVVDILSDAGISAKILSHYSEEELYEHANGVCVEAGECLEEIISKELTDDA